MQEGVNLPTVPRCPPPAPVHRAGVRVSSSGMRLRLRRRSNRIATKDGAPFVKLGGSRFGRMFGACRSAHMLKAMVNSDAAAAIIFAAMQRLLEIDSEGCHQAFMFARDKSLIRTGDGHGDRWDRQLLALWISVHRVRSGRNCPGSVGVRGQSRSPSSLVLRKLWSPDRNDGRPTHQRQDEADQEARSSADRACA